MRVTFLTQWFDPEPGAIRGLPLARELTGMGIDVEVVTGFPNYPGGKVYEGYRIRPFQRESMQGVPVVRVPLYPSHDRNPLARVANYGSFALSAAALTPLLAKPSDVVYVYHPPPTVGLPASVLRRLRKVPFVYHIADMWPESVVESGMISRRPALKAAVHWTLSRYCNWVYSEAAAITVLSEGFKRLLIERGVPASKIHVVYNWVDDDVFRPLEPDPRLADELGTSGRFNFVYAGNFGTFQALETVIRAAKAVEDIPAIQVVLIGTGTEEGRLKALAEQLGARNVRFVGRRPVDEMPRLNALAEVLLVHLTDLPFFSATIPSKTQVSLASGRAVLMGVRGDAAHVIERAGAGLVVPPDDPVAMAAAMREMYEAGPARCRAWGEAGYEFYRREMSLSVGARQMAQLFHAVRGGDRATA